MRENGIQTRMERQRRRVRQCSEESLILKARSGEGGS